MSVKLNGALPKEVTFNGADQLQPLLMRDRVRPRYLLLQIGITNYTVDPATGAVTVKTAIFGAEPALTDGDEHQLSGIFERLHDRRVDALARERASRAGDGPDADENGVLRLHGGDR